MLLRAERNQNRSKSPRHGCFVPIVWTANPGALAAQRQLAALLRRCRASREVGNSKQMTRMKRQTVRPTDPSSIQRLDGRKSKEGRFHGEVV